MSVTDKQTGRAAAGRDGDARARLRRAALELFGERGYDRTTAAQIAARAGVTERTFFRHFPDKREVLFDGEARLRAALTASVADAPPGLGPLHMLFRAFRSLQPMMDENRLSSRTRQDIIAATPALRERELAKLAALGDALADALKARGVAELRAVIAARTGMVAFAHAVATWLDDPVLDLGDRFDLAFREVEALAAERD